MNGSKKDSIVKVGIEDSNIIVTGDGPYDSRDLTSLLSELGAKVVKSTPSQAISFTVVGQRNYDQQLLQSLRIALNSDRILSQEEFFGLIFLNIQPDADLESRRRKHKGLKLALGPEGIRDRRIRLFVQKVDGRFKDLFSLSENLKGHDRKTIQYVFESKLADLESLQREARSLLSKGLFLPADKITLLSEMHHAFVVFIETLNEHKREVFFSRWPEKSEIRSKYHYSVRVGVSEYQRHKYLRNAVYGMGLYPVVSHLAAFASLHADVPRMSDAVKKWNEDREWLKKNFYQNEFRWPGEW